MVAKKKASSRSKRAAASKSTQDKPKAKQEQSMSDMPSIVTFQSSIDEAERPPLLPPKRYDAEIRSAEVKLGGSSGKPYCALTVYISPEAFPPDFEGADAYRDGINLVYRKFGLDDNAGNRWRIRQMCERFGVPATTELDVNEFVTKPCRVEVIHEEYEGESRMVADRLFNEDDE